MPIQIYPEIYLNVLINMYVYTIQWVRIIILVNEMGILVDMEVYRVLRGTRVLVRAYDQQRKFRVLVRNHNPHDFGILVPGEFTHPRGPYD